MERAAGDAHVAVYVDFDNILISQYDAVHGKGAWRAAGYRREAPSPEGLAALAAAQVDVGAILEYAVGVGRLVVNRAYADWSSWWTASYDGPLLKHSVDLVQMFPLVGTKNGADIRLAVDVVEDLLRYPHITDVLLVAGDSDYVSVAQRCRRLGRRIVGVGVRGSSARHWMSACDEFKHYDTLTAKQAVVPAPPPAVDTKARLVHARTLLLRALAQLQGNSPTGWVAQGAVRPMMVRLDPAFDTTELGFPSMRAFLDSCADVVEIVKGDSDRMLQVRSAGSVAPVKQAAPVKKAAAKKATPAQKAAPAKQAAPTKKAAAKKAPAKKPAS